MVITDGDVIAMVYGVIAMVMVVMDGHDGWSYYRDAMGNAGVSLIIGMGNAAVSPSIITIRMTR